MTRSTSLSSLAQKKVTTGLKKLQDAGITPERWLAMLDADDATMQRLATVWPVRQPSFVYDAVHLLGFGPASTEPLPDPAPGEIVIRVGDWSLKDLRSNEVVVSKNLMWNQDWYDKYPCSSARLTPGIYRLRLPVPDSNRKNFSEQQALLQPGEETAPAALAATTLIVHLMEAGSDLLKGDWTRCAEALPDEYRVRLRVREGRVYVRSGWDDDRRDSLWLAGSRKS